VDLRKCTGTKDACVKVSLASTNYHELATSSCQANECEDYLPAMAPECLSCGDKIENFYDVAISYGRFPGYFCSESCVDLYRIREA